MLRWTQEITLHSVWRTHSGRSYSGIRVPLEIADEFLTNVNNIWSFNPLLTAVINKFLTKAPEKLLTG